MKPIHLSNFSFRQIQAFLAVADTGSQTKASQYLHLSQPMISKSIAQLERELGLILFIRSRNKLSLSPAGKVLYKELKGVVSTLERAVLKAQETQKAAGAPLVIGLPLFTDIATYFTPRLQRYADAHPGFQYRLESGEMYQLPISLANGELDVVFAGVFDRASYENMGMNSKVLFDTNAQVYMRETNPLADRESLRIEDLVSQNILVLSVSALPNYYGNYVEPMFRKHGLHPNVTYSTMANESLVSNLQGDNDIFLSDDIVLKMDGFKKVPIVGEGHQIIIAWQPDANEQVIGFVKGLLGAQV